MRVITDIETLANTFSCSFLDYDSDKTQVLVINKDVNQLQELKQFLSHVKYLITLNGIHFDSIVLDWMIKQPQVTAEKIYEVAQIVINQDRFYDLYKPYSKHKWNHSWIDIDLFCYWSRGLRQSKKLSLKYFAVNMDMDIQEMPIHHTRKNLTPEELQQVLDYNMLDCRVTKELAFRLKEQINLRLGIEQQYNLKVISADAPKIASELLLDSYCRKTFQHDREFWEYKKEVRNTQFEAINFRNGDYLPDIQFKTPFFQKIYQEICDANNGFSKEFVFKHFDSTHIKITIGSGGIHVTNKNESYETTKEQEIWTSDIASLYPSLLINYKFIRPELSEVLDIYTEKKKERLEAKRTGNKIVNETLKLVLNATTGLMDSPYVWLYSPAQIMALRLTGQLILLRLFEECEAKQMKIVSINTDGQEIILKNNQKEDYFKIIELIEKEFDLEFEHEQYKFIKYQSVNDYIALTIKDKIKVKGQFIYEKVLDGSNEFLIIPLAVKEFFVNKIPIEKTIRNHTNIFNFCAAKKINRDYSITWNGQPQQQLNRFYASKKGAYLYKKKNTKNTQENIFKDSPVQLLNQVPDKFPTDVAFEFYIRKANEMIKLFEPDQLKLF